MIKIPAPIALMLWVFPMLIAIATSILATKALVNFAWKKELVARGHAEYRLVPNDNSGHPKWSWRDNEKPSVPLCPCHPEKEMEQHEVHPPTKTMIPWNRTTEKVLVY